MSATPFNVEWRDHDNQTLISVYNCVASPLWVNLKSRILVT